MISRFIQRIRATLARISWRRWAIRGALFVVFAGIAGFLVSASGIIPIKASSRHWAITRWFLNFSKERSVATHSMKVKVPELESEWKILRGAGHFETGCRPCHGSPDVRQPRIALAMTPSAPALGPEIAQWDSAELFYIVKHGIKFTGMPAWPAKGRDDEVWAMVAFLRKLPELDKDSYRAWVHGVAAPTENAPLEDLLPPKAIRHVVEQNCMRCHGADGNGRGNAAFPKIAGQREEYLYSAMRAYAEGARASGIMGPIAAGLDDESVRGLARYYSRLPASGTQLASTNAAAAADMGRRIAENGIPVRRVAACAQCHEGTTTPRNAAFPRLAGQYPEYLEQQLELFNHRARGGGPFAHLMHFTADGLTPEERRAVAAYYSTLPPHEEDEVQR